MIPIKDNYKYFKLQHNWTSFNNQLTVSFGFFVFNDISTFMGYLLPKPSL